VKFRLWHLPARAITGAFILNTGVTKLRSDDQDMHKGVHEMASTAYPQVAGMDPRTFTKLLGAAEVALGASLLTPFVSPGLAGAGLTGFSGALLGLYFRVPGMTVDGIRPSPRGIPLAKDSWLLAIGLGLMLDRASKVVRDAVPLPTPHS
jgi:hypothetical protein